MSFWHLGLSIGLLEYPQDRAPDIPQSKWFMREREEIHGAFNSLVLKVPHYQSHLTLFCRSDSSSPVQSTFKKEFCFISWRKYQRIWGYTLNFHIDHVSFQSTLSLSHEILSQLAFKPLAPSFQRCTASHSFILPYSNPIDLLGGPHTCTVFPHLLAFLTTIPLNRIIPYKA